MASGGRRDVRLPWSRLLRPYYVANLAAVLSYWVVREYIDTAPLKREDLFGFEREIQIWVLLAVSLGVQYQKSATLDEWVGKAFLWAKVAIFALLFTCDRALACWYLVAYAVLYVAVPQPEYRGATLVTTMSGGEFEDVVEGNAEPHTVWVVEFYTSWAESCRHFSLVYAQLSLRYGTDRLRFCKVDVGRASLIAERYNISLSPVGNRELPTVMLFEHGRPVPSARVPPKDAAGTVTPVIMYERNLATFFRLEHRAAVSLEPVSAEEQARALESRVRAAGEAAHKRGGSSKKKR